MPTIDNLTISLTAAGIAVDDLVVVVDVSEANERKRAQKMRIDQLAIATGALLAGTYQPLDGDLTAIAALTTTAFGRSLLTETDASTLRTTLTVYSTTQVDAADAAVAASASAALAVHTGNVSNPHAVTKAQVGLGSVENTALSTWAGSTALTTLGTVTVGSFPAANLAGTALPAAIVTSSIVTVGALTSGSIGGSFGAINVGANAITGGAISATGDITSSTNFISNATSPYFANDSAVAGTIRYGSTAANSPVAILVNNSTITTTSSTGLAVTGTLSSTGAISGTTGAFSGNTTIGTSGAGGAVLNLYGGSAGAALTITPNTTSGANGIIYNAGFIAGGAGPHIFQVGGTEVSRLSSTGLAVTGALSATGSVWSGNNVVDTSTGTTDGVTLSNGAEINLSRESNAMLNLRRRTTDGAIAVFRRDTAQVGNISVTTTATAYNTASAREMKENIEDMRKWANPMTVLNAIPIRVWDWRTFGRDKRPDDLANCGVIYDEVYPIFPDACTPGKPGKDKSGAPLHPDSVDYSKFVPLCIAGLQDHDRELTDHEKRIAALEKELAGLKAA